MGWNWYGVKTFYRTTARGRPRLADPDFEPDTIGLEERVVVFRARSEKEAARKARREARKYASLISCKNLYGQRVQIRPLEFCLAYEMDGEPSDGMEVFSSTEILEKNISDKQILGKAIGVRKEDGSRRSDRAFKFIDAEIATKLLNHFSPKTGSKG